MRSEDLVHLLQTRTAPHDEIMIRIRKEGVLLSDGEGPLLFENHLDLTFDSVDADDVHAYIELPADIVTWIKEI